MCNPNLQTRKDKKVSSVIGCELNLQLNEPGAGAACESIAALRECDKLSSSIKSVDFAPACEKAIQIARDNLSVVSQAASQVTLFEHCPKSGYVVSLVWCNPWAYV
jgi:hypothetical protein